jgi:hypothetical protein
MQEFFFHTLSRLGRQFNMPMTKHTAYHEFANIAFSEKLHNLQAFPYLVIYDKVSCIITTVSIFPSTLHFHEVFNDVTLAKNYEDRHYDLL